jgi:hypothetical protein
MSVKDVEQAITYLTEWHNTHPQHKIGVLGDMSAVTRMGIPIRHFRSVATRVGKMELVQQAALVLPENSLMAQLITVFMSVVASVIRLNYRLFHNRQDAIDFLQQK